MSCLTLEVSIWGRGETKTCSQAPLGSTSCRSSASLILYLSRLFGIREAELQRVAFPSGRSGNESGSLEDEFLISPIGFFCGEIVGETFDCHFVVTALLIDRAHQAKCL